AFGLVAQPDGRLLASGGAMVGQRDGRVETPMTPRQEARRGEFALARYLTDGALDTSSVGDGKLTTGFSGAASASALVMEPSGEFVAAGFAREGDRFQFALARYLSQGTLDPSFGRDGRLTAAIADGDAEAFAAARQPDGKVLAA